MHPASTKALRLSAAALASCFLCSCSPEARTSPADESHRRDIEAVRLEIAQLRASAQRTPTLSLLETEAALTQRLAAVEARLERRDAERQAALAKLASRLDELERRLAAQPAAAAERPPGPAAAPQQPPPAAHNAISFYERTAPASETFPVRVTEIRGDVVVTGTRVAKRYVETEALVRDEFGDKKPKKELREFDVDEFGYRIACTLENLTDAAQDLTLRSGEEARRVTLAPKEVMTNVTVAGARGAGLTVESGNRYKTFDVTY